MEKRECDLYTKSEDGSTDVTCTCCNWRCTIPEGDHGKCGVRYNKDGKLYLSVYGYPCALHVDPVEKKPLHHFLPNTDIFSVGTIGCNFKCTFCQNWDISQAALMFDEQNKEQSGDIEDLVVNIQGTGYEATPEQVVTNAIRKGCKSLAYTYNEPSIWAEYSHDIGLLGIEKGLRGVYVTNGFMTPEHLKYIKPYVSALNIDLKSFSPKFYRNTCFGGLEGVKKSIQLAHEMGFWVEVTTLIIPDSNDSDTELEQIASFLYSVSPSIPWHISAFHPDYKMTDKTRTPKETLQRAYDIGKRVGLKYIYMGNVSGAANTYCPKCNELLIERHGYSVRVKKGFKGTCTCGEVIEGIWE
ncbi:hypothetical protein WA158_004159 [Blastocystis sp. Blastoise]